MNCDRCKKDLPVLQESEPPQHWYRHVFDVWLFPTVFRYGDDATLNDDSCDTKTFDGPYYSLCEECWDKLNVLVATFVATTD